MSKEFWASRDLPSGLNDLLVMLWAGEKPVLGISKPAKGSLIASKKDVVAASYARKSDKHKPGEFYNASLLLEDAILMGINIQPGECKKFVLAEIQKG